jgi:mono/diheme cytochrome c family protein
VSFGTLRTDATLSAQDADPTFTKDVAAILYQNCATCHRPGGLDRFHCRLRQRKPA